MRTYRIYIPILLIILSIILLTKNTFTDAILLDVSYNQLTKETQKQVDCLADNIYHEAGFEPNDGKVAVAPVSYTHLTLPTID
jgi:spore germination cell wall hydrolase CwlJ-like protein